VEKNPFWLKEYIAWALSGENSDFYLANGPELRRRCAGVKGTTNLVAVCIW
jgi:hypothetical protein